MTYIRHGDAGNKYNKMCRKLLTIQDVEIDMLRSGVEVIEQVAEDGKPKVVYGFVITVRKHGNWAGYITDEEFWLTTIAGTAAAQYKEKAFFAALHSINWK